MTVFCFWSKKHNLLKMKFSVGNKCHSLNQKQVTIHHRIIVMAREKISLSEISFEADM